MAGSKREVAALSSDLGGYWASATASGGKSEKASSGTAGTKTSTQFYAGGRVGIDAAFLEKCESLPRFEGTPGTAEFRVIFGDIDEDTSLDQLQAARRSWDEHLSKIPEASKRLHACVELFHTSEWAEERSLPLFFPGEGTLADVIAFHLSVDSTSLTGPTWSRPIRFACICLSDRAFLPQGVLGDFVDQFLFHAFCGYEEFPPCRYATASDLKAFVAKLIKASPPRFVAPFFEPLGSSYVASLSFFGGPPGGTFQMMVQPGLRHKPGNNAVMSMKDFGRYLERNFEYGRMEEMAWLVGQLEAKRSA